MEDRERMVQKKDILFWRTNVITAVGGQVWVETWGYGHPDIPTMWVQRTEDLSWRKGCVQMEFVT